MHTFPSGNEGILSGLMFDTTLILILFFDTDLTILICNLVTITLGDLPNWVIVLVVCVTTAAATEVTSNVATCSILLPVLKNLAVSLQIHPLYLLLPVTLSCSYAFMLPVATPPNAIVYSASGMNTSEMVRQFLKFW